MVDVLDEDHESVTAAAEAVLDMALELIAERAKFTVVAQVKTRKGEPAGDKIALGWYPTQVQATNDALKLTYSTQTHEEHLVWVLPVWHDTPNAYYQSRKAAKKADAAADASVRERELQRRIKWCEEHPDDPIPADWGLVPWDHEVTECDTCQGVGYRRKTKEEMDDRV